MGEDQQNKLYLHQDHPHKSRDINRVHEEGLTFGQRLADAVASGMGSWPFIIIQSVFVIAWIVVNLWAYTQHYDPFPFILLNLLFSTQAAYAAPIIMQSQNRQAAKDRLMAENDFLTDQTAEHHIEDMIGHLDAQDHILLQLLEKLDRQEQLQTKLLTKLYQDTTDGPILP